MNTSEEDTRISNILSCYICKRKLTCSCLEESGARLKHRSCSNRKSYPQSMVNPECEYVHICSATCMKQYDIQCMCVLAKNAKITFITEDDYEFEDEVDIYDSDSEFFIGYGSR